MHQNENFLPFIKLSSFNPIFITSTLCCYVFNGHGSISCCISIYKNKLPLVGWFLCAIHIIVYMLIVGIKPDLLIYGDRIAAYMFPPLSVILMTQFIVAYIYITFVVLRLAAGERHSHKPILPFAIVGFFPVFKEIPGVYHMIHHDNISDEMVLYFTLAMRLNILSDAIACIFIQNQFRKIISTVFGSVCQFFCSKRGV